MEHYSEDSSDYEDEIADLMDLRQVGLIVHVNSLCDYATISSFNLADFY